MDKAMRYRERRLKVLLKYIVFRWRKEIKDQAKEVKEAVKSFRAGVYLDRWYQAFHAQKIASLRARHLFRKTITSLKLAKQLELSQMRLYRESRVKRQTLKGII